MRAGETTAAAAGHRVLILFAHPALHRSRVNRALVRAVRDVADVTFHDLYELYPDFDVDRCTSRTCCCGTTCSSCSIPSTGTARRRW